MKVCISCGIEKEENDFHQSGHGRRRRTCKKCHNKNWKYCLLGNLSSKESLPPSTLVKGVRKPRKPKDKRVDMKFLESLKDKQNGLCYWLNIPLDFTMKDKLRKPSIDRLDNSRGYDADNIVLTTVFANTGRRDASVEEMKSFLDNYIFFQKIDF